MTGAAAPSPFSLASRRVLVTGASSGLGRAIAVALSRLGASLVLTGRDAARLEETRALLETGEHTAVGFDLRESGPISAWLGELAQPGPLHGLVHCAGVQLTAPLKAMSLAAYEDLMAVNVTAAVALAQGFRQRSVHAPESAIVFLSSVMAVVGQPGLSAYATSKAALGGLARSLAVELARDRIRVNCVAPGHVKAGMAARLEARLTPEQLEGIERMHPLGLGAPEDVAHAVAFLLAPSGRWVTGTTLLVDGGYTAH